MLYEWGGEGMRFSLIGISWRENVTTNFWICSINSSTNRTLLVMEGDKLLVLNTKSRGRGLQT